MYVFALRALWSLLYYNLTSGIEMEVFLLCLSRSASLLRWIIPPMLLSILLKYRDFYYWAIARVELLRDGVGGHVVHSLDQSS